MRRGVPGGENRLASISSQPVPERLFRLHLWEENMNAARAVLGFLTISALASAAGCDMVGSERQPLTAGGSGIVEQKPTSATPDAGVPETAVPLEVFTRDASAPTPLPGTYEAMCLHYCETLEETLVYSCLVSVGADDCASRFMGTVAQCVDLRCTPKLVTPSLCLVQCDALTTNQSSYCKTAPATAPVCASPPAAQNQACRAGCAVDSP
jgi:hypothetical protein